MHTARLISILIMALVLMGCPPPVSDNPDAPASDPDAPAESAPDPKPKAIVLPRVSAGGNHSMIVMADDTLWAFGDNQYGQLGNGNSGDDVVELTPVPVLTTATGPAMTEIAQVSAGYKYTMIIKKNDTLWAVGLNDSGQLGDGSKTKKSIAIQVKEEASDGETTPMTDVAQVSVGYYHTMILKENSELWAVGDNSYGTLGDGTTYPHQIPVAVKTAEGLAMTEVDQVSAGALHTMILKRNGTLWTVGSNSKGQLGNDRVGDYLIEMAPVKIMTDVKQISAGGQHSMILKENGELWAVGLNDSGQLGDGSKTNKSIAVQVKEEASDGETTAMTDVAQVSAGGNHSMILKENGSLWAVGLNDNGQLGDNSTDDKKFPVQVKTADGTPMTNVAQVSAGGNHTLIVKRDGTIWAVGLNDKGQLGDGKGGANAVQLIPVEITVP